MTLKEFLSIYGTTTPELMVNEIIQDLPYPYCKQELLNAVSRMMADLTSALENETNMEE